MPRGRGKKPVVVDRVESENRVHCVDVFFDHEQKDFFVVVPGMDKIRDLTVAGVKRKAAVALGEIQEFDWKPIIVVRVGEAYDDERETYGRSAKEFLGARCDFTFRRLEVSPSPKRDGYFFERPHELDFEAMEPDDEDREVREKNLHRYRDRLEIYKSPPGTNGRSMAYEEEEATHEVELPYAQETWAGLLALKRSVDDARDRLEAMIKRKDFEARLQLVARRGIPALLQGKAGR